MRLLLRTSALIIQLLGRQIQIRIQIHLPNAVAV